MKYVMSDLHGCYNKFIDMLNLIDFNEEDTLYILGDIFDRGDEPLKILNYIVSHENIILLKGNHELFFERYCEDNSNLSLWYGNCGQITHSQIMQQEYPFEKSLYNYIRNLSIFKVVDKFILVHAGFEFIERYDDLNIGEFLSMQDLEDCLWNRDNIGKEKQYRDYTIICGHTPVQLIEKDRNTILHRKGTVYVDCGCTFDNGRLACLRLDDMREFYV